MSGGIDGPNDSFNEAAFSDDTALTQIKELIGYLHRRERCEWCCRQLRNVADKLSRHDRLIFHREMEIWADYDLELAEILEETMAYVEQLTKAEAVPV